MITDPLTSRSKGYGFVRFGSEAERDRALGEMSGHFISNRPIRVSLATAKKSSSLQVRSPCCGSAFAVSRLTPIERGGYRQVDEVALFHMYCLVGKRQFCCLQHGAGLGTGGGPAGMHGALGDLDPSNTTLFIGGLSAAVSFCSCSVTRSLVASAVLCAGVSSWFRSEISNVSHGRLLYDLHCTAGTKVQRPNTTVT